MIAQCTAQLCPHITMDNQIACLTETVLCNEVNTGGSTGYTEASQGTPVEMGRADRSGTVGDCHHRPDSIALDSLVRRFIYLCYPSQRKHPLVDYLGFDHDELVLRFRLIDKCMAGRLCGRCRTLYRNARRDHRYIPANARCCPQSSWQSPQASLSLAGSTAESFRRARRCLPPGQ